MKVFRSLRVQFALWTAALILFTLVLFGVVIYLGIQQELSRSFDDSMRLTAAQAIAAISTETDQIDYSDGIPNPSEAQDRQRGVTIRIISLTGKVMASSGPFSHLAVNPKSIRQANAPIFETISPAGVGPIRVYTAPVAYRHKSIAVIQVLDSINPLTGTLHRILKIFLFSIPLSLIVSALGGYWLATRALTPIDQIIQRVQSISANDLSARLNLTATSEEVSRLASTLDQMLARLEDSFLRERQFTADASHELRTPLTATRAILNVTRSNRRSADEYEKALDDIATQTDRLHRLTEDLLYMARGEFRKGPLSEPVNLTELLTDVCESLAPVVGSKGLSLAWQIQEGLFILGDRDDLIRLFGNLIDNAAKYTETGRVSVDAARSDEQHIGVCVADTGRGIPAQDLPLIFQRFYRADPSRSSPGTGLGLAIVQEIVQAHQATIRVSSQLGVGTKFTLEFPVHCFGIDPYDG